MIYSHQGSTLSIPSFLFQGFDDASFAILKRKCNWQILDYAIPLFLLTLILRHSGTGTVWCYTSTSSKIMKYIC
jgi:hypothetical protein